MAADLEAVMGLVLDDPLFQQEQSQRQAASQMEAVRRGLTLEPPKHAESGLAALKHTTRKRRAESIVQQQDAAARANPDIVRQQLDRLRSGRSTGGDAAPGLDEVERTRRTKALLDDDQLLDFHELHPESRIYAADDTSYAEAAYDIVRHAPGFVFEEATEAGRAVVTGGRMHFVREELADTMNRIQEARAFGFGADNLPALEAEADRLRRRLSELTGPGEQDRFDRILNIASQVVTMSADSFVDAGVATGKVVIPLTAATTAGGAGLGALAGGVGAGPGAVGGAAVGLSTTPFTFKTMLFREFTNLSRGLAYNNLVESGFDPDDPATIAGATMQGALEAWLEQLSFNALSRVVRPSLAAGRVHASRIVGKNLTNWLRKPTKAALLRRRFSDVVRAAGAETAEEFLQNTLAVGVGESIAARQGEGALGSLVGVADLPEIFDRASEGLEEALAQSPDIFLAVALTGGAYRGATSFMVHRAEAQLAKEQEFFEAWAEHADSSTMIQRSKKSAGDFLDFILNQDQTDRSNVYVETEAFEAALESNRITLDEAEVVMPGVKQRLEDAKASGRRLQIPAKEFAQSVAGSNVMEGIREHVSTTEDGLTSAERRAQQRASRSTAERLGDERYAQVKARLELEDSADRVTARLAQQLVSTGRLTVQNATENMKLFRTRLLTFAEQLSQTADRRITPEEAFQLAPLGIVPPDGEMQVTDEMLLGQPQVRSAAIQVEGRVFVGPNHAEAFIAAADTLGTDDFAIENEGFVTTDGEFLDRRQAADRFAPELGEAASEDFAAQESQIIDESELGEVVLGQPSENVPRGQIGLRDNAALIRLTNASDPTTFAHELSHYFLHQMVVAWRMGLANDQMRRDLQTVVDYTGAADVESLVLPFEDGRFQPGTTVVDKPHEVFARGWEAYLATAEAPTPELRSLFRRFRRWAVFVYDGIREVTDRVGRPLSPEIRGVYDRLLSLEIAVDDELGNFSDPLISDPKQVGLDADSPVYQRYLESWDKLRERALDEASKAWFGRARRLQKQMKRELREQIRREVEAEVDADPAMQAIHWIRRGESPPGADLTNPGTGLSPTRLDDIYGNQAERVTELLNETPGRGRRLVNRRNAPVEGIEFYVSEAEVDAPDGLDPDDVAEAFGFGSGKQMVDAMMTARPAAERIEAEVARRIDRAPEFSEAAVRDIARQAVSTEDRERLLRAELRLIRDFLTGAATDQARRDQADTGRPAASAAASQVATARAQVAEAQAQGDEAVARAAQVGLVEARAGRQAAAEGRRAARGAARRLAAVEAQLQEGSLKRRAERLVGDGTVARLRVERNGWLATSRREGRKARKAVAEGRFDDAAEAVERQLLAHYAATEAGRLVREVEKGRDFLAKFRTGKALDRLRAPGLDGASVVTGILARFDLRKGRTTDPDKPPTRMERKLRSAIERAQRTQEFESLLEFKKNADDQAKPFDFPAWLSATGGQTTHWTELSVSQFLGLVDTVKNVEKVTRDRVRDIRTGIEVERQQAAAEVSGWIRSTGKTRRQEKRLRAVGLSPDNLARITRQFDAAWLKVESMLDFMGGDDINNPVRRWIWTPIEQAAIRYRGLVDSYTSDVEEVLGSFDYRRMNKKLKIPQLDRHRAVTYAEVVMMGLNWGNESNRAKLVNGYGNHRRFQWTEEGIQAAIDRIEDDDWDRIQQIWNLMSKPTGDRQALRDLVFDHEFEQTGRRPTAIEATPFTTRSGKQMQGGYFPVQYDPALSERARQIAEKEELKGLFGYSYTRAETDQGHVKSRSEGFSRPILLDPLVIGRHMDHVLRDVAFRRAVTDVNAVLESADVRAAITDTWGKEYHDAIQRWLKKVAGVRNSDYSEGPARVINDMSRYTRQGTTMVGLGFRIFTGLLQLSGAFPAFAEVGPRWAMGSTLKMLSVVGGKNMIDNALEHSSELRSRWRTRDRDMAATLNALSRGTPPAIRATQEHAFIFISMGDRVVSTIAWDAQYHKSTAQGATHEQAVQEADRAIRRTQGAGDVQDLSNIMASEHELARWLTIFGSFASNLYAQQRRMYRLGAGSQVTGTNADGTPLRKRNLRHALALWSAYILLPAVIESILRGDTPEEDDDPIGWAMRRTTTFMAMPFKFIAEPLEAALEPRKRVFLGRSPASRIYRPIINLYDNTTGAWFEGEDFDEKDAVSDTLSLIGIGLHLPVGQLDLWVDNFWGDLNVEHPGDLIVRKPRERRQ